MQAVFGTIEWFERIVEGAPVAMVLLDPRQRIALVNHGAEQLFGHPRAALVGQPLDVLLPVHSRRAHEVLAGDYLRAPRARLIGEGRDLKGLHASGAEIPVEIGLSPLQAPDGCYTLASIVDLRERQRAERDQGYMAAVVESAEDAVITRDMDGLIQTWNPGAERLLGYAAAEILGQPVARLIPPERGNDEALIVAEIGQGKRIAQYETLRRRKDGSLVEVSLTVSPILDRVGHVVGAAKIMQDISRRKRAELELQRTNEQLLRVNQALDEFVYTASHDLRAPLVGVNRLAQWILEDDPTVAGKSRERLLTIQGRITRMARLLDDIRDYARAGQGPATAGLPMAASELVTDVLSALDVPAGFTVRCDAPSAGVPVSRVPLQQVLHNLIANALKHHDRATGTISVTIQEQGERLRFIVEDDGPGIPLEYRQDIFDMFRTLRPRDVVEGSGMGLALVRRIVGRMGGACGVEGPPGRGARFWFDWPRTTWPTESIDEHATGNDPPG